MTTPRSRKPRISLEVSPDLLPKELTTLNRWVNWTPVWNDSQQRWDKPPVDGKTDRRIDCTKAENLKPLEEFDVDDDWIIEQLADLPLWNGGLSEHNGDHSAADLALCNLIAQHTDDPEQVDRIFRRSGLMRDKWDERRGSRTYGEMTVEKALDGDGNRQETRDTEHKPSASKGRRVNPWKTGDWGDELMDRTFPEPRWAIEGLLPEGVTLLAGTKSIGKSWFALNAGISVAEGSPAFGKIPVRQGKVLYLSLEDGDRLLQTRLHILLDGDRSRLAKKSFAPRYTSDLLGHGFESGLEGWMNDFPDTRLVVVDLLANIFLPQEKKSEYFVMYHAVSRLCKTADKLHVSMLVLHHTNTRNEAELNDPFDAIMGGQGIKACVAGCMLLYRQRFNTSMSLMLAGKHVREAVFNLERDESWRIRLVDDPPKAALTPERLAIQRAVAMGHQTPKAVGEYLGKSPDAMRKAMARMVEAGQLKQLDYGKFAPV
jgi:hypothetical protein